MMDPILQAKENELITAAVDTGGKKKGQQTGSGLILIVRVNEQSKLPRLEVLIENKMFELGL